jgi:hypothetical protein
VTPDAMLRKEAQDALDALWRLLGKNGSTGATCARRETHVVEVAATLLGIDVPIGASNRSWRRVCSATCWQRSTI